MRYGRAIAATACALAALAAFVATVGSGEHPGEGRGNGRGRGEGRGRGKGRGPVSRWLDLTAEQAAAVTAADPTFDEESRRLRDALAAAREKLAALLEQPSTPDEGLSQQIERVIGAHNTLERRVARHVLAIRKHLTAGQQKQLLGLCAAGVRRAAGRGWRRGRGGAAGPGLGRGGRGGGGRGSFGGQEDEGCRGGGAGRAHEAGPGTKGKD